MKKLILTGMLALGTFIAGCGAVDNAIDCNAICNRYKSCYDQSYDVGACDTRCRANANANKDFMRGADACNDCLGDKSCATSFSCSAQCAGIVP